VLRTGLFDTIRVRLTALNVGTLAVSLSLFGLVAYGTFSHSIHERQDEGLKATLDTVAIAFRTGIGVERGDEVEAAHHMLNELRFPNRKVGIYTLDGRPFPATDTKPGHPEHVHGPAVEIDSAELARLAREGGLWNADGYVLTTRGASDSSRLALTVVRSPSSGTRFLVAAEEPSEEVGAMLALLRNGLLLTAPLFLLFACAAGWFLARRSLAPIAAMSQRAQTIGADSLGERLPVANERDEIGQLALVFNDLLDRLARAFGDLERAYGRMRQFIADASHELRTPVAAIRGEAQVTLRQERGAGEYRESIGVILEEATHMARIVEDLFTLARADAGERPVESLPYYLDEVVVECVRSVRSLAAEQGVELRADVSADVEMVGDEGLVRRAVLNLLHNALKYTEQGGRVHARVTTDGTTARVDVTDTGIGIAPEDRERIFERFYRVDSARTRSEGGAGLGLSIVRWAAETHSGTVAVQSELGRGSTFSLFLPRVTAKPIRTRASTSPAVSTAK